MNRYEFWDDMDKIFNAVVAYQEKTIEFNKRFITPWVNLGNVFEKREDKEEILAHKNAIEIDPDNAQNWFELANVYIQAGDFDKSLSAYQKALDLGQKSGELYKNLALAHAMTGKHQDSISLFEKSLTLLEKNEDKAVVWNHIGNVHRKLSNYGMALQAFQQADQLENKISAVSDEQTENPATKEKPTAEVQPINNPDSENTDGKDTFESDTNMVTVDSESPGEQPDVETLDEKPASLSKHDLDEEIDSEMPVILELDYSSESQEEMQNMGVVDETEVVETLADQPEKEFLDETDTEDDNKPGLVNSIKEELQEEQETDEDEHTSPEKTSKPSKIISFLQKDEKNEQGESEVEAVVEVEDKVEENTNLHANNETQFEEELKDYNLEESVSYQECEDEPVLSAYEEYLKDHQEPVKVDLATSDLENSASILLPPPETDANNSELHADHIKANKIKDVESKNAHVWNELGNVYFNAGSFDDAISSYTKAIELDTLFAWPYTNLALSYVQKGRLDEAVLLYQRSIELFSNENDKAVTWNRLGNVYRRLNDYENAIAAYQRADELDPGNVAITEQSRFSLLGSEEVNQEVGYSL